MATTMSDVQRLTDDQLFDMLHQFFPVIGPVVDSTRSVYQSMLFNKLTELGDGGVSVEFPENPVDPETTENLGSVESSADDVSFPSPPKPKPHQFKRWNEEEDDLFGVQNFSSSQNIRSRSSVYDKVSPGRYVSPPPQPLKKQGSAAKKLIVVTVFFVLAGIIMFIMNQKQDPYQNIESEADSLSGDV